MPFEIRTWKFGVPLVGTLFLAAACGGGGSGSDSSSERATLATFLTAASVAGTEDDAAEHIILQAVAAAAQAPVGTGTTGGVYQHDSGTDLAATPQIVIATNSDGRRTFDITIGPDTINTVANAAGTMSTTTNEVDNSGLTETVATDDEGSGERDFVTFVQRQGTAAATTGSLHVWVSTDTPNSVGGDEDYLAYGFWVNSRTGDGQAPNDGLDEIGAFVDSSDTIAFAGTSVTQLTGTAVYLGEASGLYQRQVGNAAADFGGFEADARLTAAFGEADELGTIAGTISNFVFSGTDQASPLGADPSVTLSAADFTAETGEEGGLFVGTTSASLTLPGGTAATGFEGAWGGKLYDDRNLAVGEGNYPGTVAGTFGIQDETTNADDSTLMDRTALLGVFWGDYNSNPPAVTP